MNDILLHSVLEFVLVLTPFDIAIGHNAHDLLVVVQDRETRQLGLLIQESRVAIRVVLVLRIGLAETRRCSDRLRVHGLGSSAVLISVEARELSLCVAGALGPLTNGQLHSEFVDGLPVVVVESFGELAGKAPLLAGFVLEEVVLALEVVFVFMETKCCGRLIRITHIPFLAILLAHDRNEFVLVQMRVHKLLLLACWRQTVLVSLSVEESLTSLHQRRGVTQACWWRLLFVEIQLLTCRRPQEPAMRR